MERDEYIELYFRLGYSQKEILACLACNDGIVISQRHLRRILRKLDLKRRIDLSDILEVAAFIEEQLQGSGQLYGYRWMHFKCIQEGYVVTQNIVRALLLLLDPDGVAARRGRRLTRRRYINDGPNHTWHIDGYDKLKPYGLCIDACIDGFSRKIIWCDVSYTNKNPKLILSYYLKAVSAAGGCPRRIRADPGTENGHVEQIQTFLRRDHADHLAGNNSFLYGSSVTNQRIEAWWGFFRKHCAQYWMTILQELKDEGHFGGFFLDKNVMQFCCMKLVQVIISASYNTMSNVWWLHINN